MGRFCRSWRRTVLPAMTLCPHLTGELCRNCSGRSRQRRFPVLRRGARDAPPQKKSRTPTPSLPLALFHFSLHHGRTVFMKSPPLPKRPAVSRSDPFRRRGGKAAFFCRPAKRGTWKKRPIKSSCKAGAPFTGVFYGPAAVTKSRRRHKNWPGRTSPPGRAKHAPFTAAAVRPRLPPKGGRGRRG